MKNLLITILLVIPSIVFGQSIDLGSDNCKVSIDEFGTISTVSRILFDSVYHVQGGFADSATSISITEDNWFQVTNEWNNLWTGAEIDGFIFSGDTMEFGFSGDAWAIVSFTFSANNTNEYQFRLYDVSNTQVVGIPQGDTGRGTNNYSHVTLILYFEGITSGDRFVMEVTNTSASNAATMRFGGFLIFYAHD